MGSLPDSKYIIQTDGYWFVEAHDVDPSKGYVTVSAKGIINGLSNQPNDGADFGPDSYNPNYSGSGIPYTQTSGIQEALTYVNPGDAVGLLQGDFEPTDTITITKNVIFMGIPSATQSLGPLSQSPDEYGLYPVNVKSPGNKPTFTIEFPGGTSTNGVTGFVYFHGITLTGTDNIDNTLEVAIESGNGSYQNVNVQFQNSRITTYYDCVHVGSSTNHSYVEFNSIHSLFDSFLNGGIYCISGELYVSQSHVNNSVMNVYASTSYGYKVETTFQKVTINGTISETALDTFQFFGSLGHVEITGGHWYNNYGGNVFHLSGNSGELMYIANISTYAGPGTADSFYFDSGAAVDNFTANSVFMGGNGGVSFASGTTIGTNFLLTSIFPHSKVTVTTPSVPTSGTAQQNTNPYPVNVYLYGGTVTAVNYTPAGGSATQVGTSGPATVRLNPGDSITLTYSAAPTWNWVAV